MLEAPPPQPAGPQAIPSPIPRPPGIRPLWGLDIARTSTGLLLLAVSVLLQWIPIIEYLGLLLGIIGAVLMILGLAPFGRRHQTLVWVSVGLYVLTFFGEFLLTTSFAFSVARIGSSTGPTAADEFLTAWDGFEVGSLVAVSFVSISFALIAFGLEDWPGRLLLLAGVLLQIVISLYVLVVVLDPILREAVAQAFASNPVNVAVIEAANAQINGLSGLKLLNAIPALLFAVAYLWARRRIERGVIPAAAPPPGTTAPARGL